MDDWTGRRAILHVDMDAFYASIEQRDHPELRGQPVIVGGSNKRGVVATCSYEARRFGIHSAMPSVEAARRCPDAIFVPVRMSHYAAVSRQIMEVLAGFSPLVEPLSLDEAFLDMTGTQRLFGAPLEAAHKIKRAIFAQTRLTCSVGVATNKFLAKLASDLDKPDGITLIPPDRARSFIANLDIRKIWGVGPRAAQRLRARGFHTIGDVANSDPRRLAHATGDRFARHVQRLARGLDDRPVIVDRDRKSVGSERTLPDNLIGRVAVTRELRRQIEAVTKTLRRKELRARGVRVKLRYDGTFQLATRQGRLPTAADDSVTLFNRASRLLASLDLDQPIRLVGASAFDLIGADTSTQIDLFATPRAHQRSELERTLDDIAEDLGAPILRGRDVE